jgi:hypothetical protein
MYNRYIPQGNTYTRVQEPDIDDLRPPQMPAAPPPAEEAPPARVAPLPPPPAYTAARAEGQHRAHASAPATPPRGGSPLSGLLGSLPFRLGDGKGLGGISGILKGLKLDDIDTGDILLLLILLFLFLESDDEELIITLGLLLIIGL